MQVYELEVANHPEISEEERVILWPYTVKTETFSVKGSIALPYAKETLTAAIRCVMEQLTKMFPPPEGVTLCPWLLAPPLPPVAVNWPAVSELKKEGEAHIENVAQGLSEAMTKLARKKKKAPPSEVVATETVAKENPAAGPFNELTAYVETEADHDSGQKLRPDEILYIKGDPRQKDDCLKLIEKLAGVTRGEIPRYPEIGGAASRCLISMVNNEMVFYREGAVSKEVAELFAQNIPRVKGA